MRVIKPGTSVRFKVGERFFHGIVTVVASQDALTVRLGHQEVFDVVRLPVPANRPNRFGVPAE